VEVFPPFSPRDARLWCNLVDRQHPACVTATSGDPPSPWTARRPHATGRRTGPGQHPGGSWAQSPRPTEGNRVPRTRPAP